MAKRNTRARRSKPALSGIEFTVSATELEFIYDENAPAVYTDGVRMMGSRYDVILILTRAELGPGTQPRQKHVGTLYMSREHARALVDVLANQLAETDQLQG